MKHILKRLRIKSSLSSDWNLDDTEVETRRIQYGVNDIVDVRTNRWAALAIDTIKDPMIWFLLGTSLLFALLKNYDQALVLLIAIIPITGMDAFLHWRTQASLQGLRRQLSLNATVIRKHVEMVIPSRDLVPGDLVVVSAGTSCPADGVFIAGNAIQIDESTLTGESVPIKKGVLDEIDLNIHEQAIDGSYWGFAGTRVLTGRALLRVVYTGGETLYGEIVRSTLQVTQERTPLQMAIAHLVYMLLLVATALCLVLAAVRLYQGFGLIDAILSAATLAVAALPDEFPVVFTFFLGVGVYRLAQKKALVRRAVSVENIGRVTVICSDKTGTITEGYFHLTRYVPAETFDHHELLLTAATASRIDSGDLLDLAIFMEVEQLKITIPERRLTTPFTENRKRESSIISLAAEEWRIATKGAPETILAISTLTAAETAVWLQRVNDLAVNGYKVIACAQMTLNMATQPAEPESGYQFVGLLAFSDPPRKGVFNAIRMCEESQIHVLMITGDHPETARAIASAVGLGGGQPNVINGQDFEACLQEKGSQFLQDVHVIARALPAQKLEIVTALQALHEIVAVTGDGVNDVPALKAADVGIAMGERGAESAREVSDVVLLNDNFDSIVQAIAEGRQLFKNMQSSFKYLLMFHMPLVISAAIIPLLGFPLLYYPIHIVFIELIIHPTAMLVFQDLPKPGSLEPVTHRERTIRFFNRFEWLGIALTGGFATCVVVFSYLFFIDSGADHARALVFAELFVFSAAFTAGLSGCTSITSQAIIFVTLLSGILLIQIPWLSRYLLFTPLHFHDWLLVMSSGLFTLVLTRLISSQKTL